MAAGDLSDLRELVDDLLDLQFAQSVNNAAHIIPANRRRRSGNCVGRRVSKEP